MRIAGKAIPRRRRGCESGSVSPAWNRKFFLLTFVIKFEDPRWNETMKILIKKFFIQRIHHMSEIQWRPLYLR